MDNSNENNPVEENGGISVPPPPPPPPPGIKHINIEDDMKTSYLDYAMSVIVGRALPDVRDGLKPVHRRVLYAMFDQGITSKKPFVKSARTVGEVLGKYHPHGDSAVYDTLVRMAQDFSLRYPLINGHGNFGSIDGDEAAAMRYTEARLHALAEELLKDIEMETVEWMPNFDGSLEEPIVLPSKFPNLLVNGSSGIAVGMATNMPSHNLSEIIDGLVHLINDPEVTIDELMQHIPGPDFPTGGIIMGTDGIESAFKTGRGSIMVRSVVEIEDFSKGRDRIVVKELPYQVNKARLVKSIADLIKDKKIDGITDLRDESSREGMRVCIELRKGVNTDVILNQLYKHTQMQSSFGVINLVLVDNRPLVLNLKQMMEYYISHCREVIRRRTIFQLRKAEEKAHILEGLTIALDNLDAVIALIKSAKDPIEAKQGLMDTFMLSDRQSQAILEMRLQRLTGLERDKIIAEYHETLALIQKLKGILESDEKVREIIREELADIKARFGDARRTQITRSLAEKLNVEDLMQEEDIIITLTKNGYVKRMSPTVFRQISRGSKGSNVMGVKDEDVVEHMFLATTHSYLLVFTSIGKVHWIKGYQIPEGGRQASGRAMVNLLQFEEHEALTAIMPIKKFDDIRRVFMVTRKGVSKMVMLSAFARPMARGIIALKLDDGDELIAVKTIQGGEQVVIATRNGYAIRFPESEVRVMGRAARGVKAITFREKNDEVIGMEVFSRQNDNGELHVAVVPSENSGLTVAAEAEVGDEEAPGAFVDEVIEEEVIDEIADDENALPEDTGSYQGRLLTVSALGFGKKTDIKNYRVTHRGGKGVINLKIMEKTGEVLAIKRMFEGDELMVVTTNGKVVRLSADSIRNTGRAASGVKLITLDSDDRLISVVRIPSQEELAD
ncbi:MAG TPA: DNA gyrase subunit A [Candidatus Rifleibacterium sp.]|nr:DNA gyrase subunit A [Candidatus Rifleibacterium sp.]HPT45258.1 DNA gyrase subunit A [Candidatus Rifleibacterium sp.]